MSLPKYPAYKHSGVKWLGEVPEHWELKRLKHLCKVQTGDKDTVNAIPDGAYPFFVRSQTVEAINSYTFDCEAVLTAGDGVGVGKVFHYVNGKFDFHQRVYMMNEFIGVSGKYFFSYLSGLFAKVALDGVAKSTVDSLRLPIFLNFPFTVPPKAEQTLIAQFLDRETAKIDDLIAEQEKLITLLDEKRQAMISHAVTKGLNPNAPMKDSGVEWLGEVPESWEVWKLAHAFDYIGSGTTPKSENRDYYENGEFFWLNTGDLNDGLLFNCKKKITTLALQDHSSLRVYPKDSLAIAMYGATIGKLALLKFETTVNQACCVFGKSNIFHIQFLFYLLLGYRERIISLAIGGGQPNINQDILRSLKFACPNLNEQSAIISYLDKKTKQLDALKAEAQRGIDLLKERRSALISAAVTGKIDVRHAVTEQVAT